MRGIVSRFDGIMKENEINEYVLQVMEQIDSMIFDTKGILLSLEIELPAGKDYCSQRYFLGRYWDKYEGPGVENAKKVIARLPDGIIGKIVVKKAYPSIYLSLSISKNYAAKAYNQFINRSFEFAKRINEKHHEVLVKLAEYVKAKLNTQFVKDSSIEATKNGLYLKCLGENEGFILYKDLLMEKLEADYTIYALATAIKDVLDQELDQENTYYLRQRYDKILKMYIVEIKIEMDSDSPILNRW